MQTSASIVVDCSLLADLLLTPSAITAELDLVPLWHAPDLVRVELLSVLRGHVLAGRLSQGEAREALADAEALNLRYWHLEQVLGERVLQLAHNFSAYDATYVALAEALDVPLATRDRRLAAAARQLISVWEV
ncbi:MAG: type II toxin-antitoxin system VapC family toxin [Propionibacteriaceae bacterium]|nr:type II toxin-antitoxin system VapC family toxin [Propionibacteriaceae bacterium]